MLSMKKFNDMQWNESDSEIAVHRENHVNPIIIYAAPSYELRQAHTLIRTYVVER